MRKILASFIGLVLIVSCGSTSDKKNSVGKKDKTSHSFKIVMSENLEPTKGQFTEVVNNSATIIRRFAKKYGWEGQSTDIYFDSIMVFSDKTEFDNTYNLISGKNVKLSDSDCVVLIERTLLCMSQEFSEEHSVFATENTAYEKYITYTLAKALHVNILFGNEAAAGPYWFREGFALLAADMFNDKETEITEEKLLNIVSNPGKAEFKNYAILVRYLSEQRELKSFVDLAASEGFNDTVVSVIKASFLKESNQ